MQTPDAPVSPTRILQPLRGTGKGGAASTDHLYQESPVGYITVLDILNCYEDTYLPKHHVCKQRGAVVELDELIYALHEMKRIDGAFVIMGGRKKLNVTPFTKKD